MAESTNTYQRIANAILTAMDKRERSFQEGQYFLTIRQALEQSTKVPEIVDIATIMMVGDWNRAYDWAIKNTTKKPMSVTRTRPKLDHHGAHDA